MFLLLSQTICPQWYQQNSGITNDLYCVSFSDENHGWAAGASSTIIRTTNGGTDWIVQSSAMSYEFINDIQSLNVNIGKAVVCGDVSSIVIGTTDGGISWWMLASDFYTWQFSLFFVNPNVGWTVGDYGTIYKTTDGGFNWTSQNSGSGATFRDVFFIDENIGIAVGSSGTIRRTTDGGQNWITQISGTTSYLISVSFVDANNGWIATIDGTVLRTTNGGTDWTSQSIGSVAPLRCICFMDLNNGIVVGLAGKIFKTTNGGVTWFEQSSGTTTPLECVSFLDPFVGTSVGWNGTILHTVNGGIPVELTSLATTVLQNEKAILLNWTTATEINNRGFEIQRLQDYKIEKFQDLPDGEAGWKKIGFVQGFGTTTEPKSYSFTDKDVTTGTPACQPLVGKPAGRYKYRLKQIDLDGTFSYSKEIEVVVDFTTKEFVLYQNYPNPFNPTTTIKYTIPYVTSGFSLSEVTLKVYDVLGNEVATLVNEEKKPGVYEVEFDASGLSSSVSAKGRYASGVYFYQLKAGNFSSIKKMILLR